MNPRLIGLYIFVSEIEASLRFYRLLGLDTEPVSDSFARVSCGGEVVLELGTAELTRSYDPGWQTPGTQSKGTMNFELASREAVDAKFEEMVNAGYTGHLAPCDPLWQARFAIVLDPDGNQVGLHSPRSTEADRERERV